MISTTLRCSLLPLLGAASLAQVPASLVPVSSSLPVFENGPGGVYPIGIATGSIVGPGPGSSLAQAVVAAERDSDRVTIYSASGGSLVPFGSPIPVGTRPCAVAIGDVTGDGLTDIVVVCNGTPSGGSGSGTNGPSVHILSQPTGSWSDTLVSQSSTQTVDLHGGCLRLGDVSGDGTVDLVVGLPGGGVQVFSRGTGSVFGLVATIATIVAPRSVQLVRAGAIDNIYVCGNGPGVAGVQGIASGGGGTFTAGGLVATSNTPIDMTVGDFDHDGTSELVVACLNALDRFTVAGNAVAANGSTAVPGGWLTGVAAADFDADTRLDVAAIDDITGAVHILRNTTAIGATSSFQLETGFATGRTGGSLRGQCAVIDINGDNSLDVVCSRSNADRIVAVPFTTALTTYSSDIGGGVAGAGGLRTSVPVAQPAAQVFTITMKGFPAGQPYVIGSALGAGFTPGISLNGGTWWAGSTPTILASGTTGTTAIVLSYAIPATPSLAGVQQVFQGATGATPRPTNAALVRF